MNLRPFLLALAALATVTTAAAESYRLAPFKDDLFKYPGIIASEDKGNYVLVDYSKPRDLYGRDAVVEKRAKPEYVSVLVPRTEDFEAAGKTLQFQGVGKTAGGAKAIVIYLHGYGGNRFQGVNNWMFGGNFNRIMNLMAANEGAYLSPDFSDFGTAGEKEIRSLILAQQAKSPGAAIFVACGSRGGEICWKLAADPVALPHIAGLLLLGSSHDEGFLKSASVVGNGRRFPIYLGHGTLDPIFDWHEKAAFYRKARAAAPAYPIRLALFQNGVHGTPIRMTDWRLVLNWMLEVDGR